MTDNEIENLEVENRRLKTGIDNEGKEFIIYERKKLDKREDFDINFWIDMFKTINIFILGASLGILIGYSNVKEGDK